MNAILGRKERVYFLSSLSLSLTIISAIITYNLVLGGWGKLFRWPGWIMVIAIFSVINTLGVTFLILRILVPPPKDNTVEIQFLISLGEDLNQAQIEYSESLALLKNYPQLPEIMSEEEWNNVVRTLNKFYNSLQLFYKVALGVKDGKLDDVLFSTCYRKFLPDSFEEGYKMLLAWCGTGLEKEAGYSLEDIQALMRDIQQLYQIV